ncbi:Predicted PurR-regulated permease PerM [Nannocystis exedens]|uniref:Predicted PurR-regulated permease PerM n=1 Tax=Nannocystis exedens TaxID=54 RepID=A0A1I1X573_9BACT|nr:AI-2E family transporter [Nannocystis exedens]PCC70801.1 AI-2E family transporter [Nannocystis exedens]SFE02519.1 Predicted PurR-regulated permease PerM [Nannocystis exedens]
MDERAEDKREKVRWLILLSGVALAFYLCWLMLQPFVRVLLWGLVLTSAFGPVHNRIRQRIKNQDVAALVSCFAVMLAIGVPTALIGLALVRELAPAFETLQAMISSLLDPNSPVIGKVAQWLSERGVDIAAVKQQAIEQAQQAMGELTSNSIGYVRGILGGIAGIVIEVFFVFFTMFYLFRDGAKLWAALANALPLRGRTMNQLIVRIREVISASVYGVFVIAVMQGTLGGLAFWVIGLPSAVVWGLVMTFMSLIPLAGAFVVWVPAAIYLAVTGSWGAALGLTLWGSLVIGLVDNFLRPKLVGEKAKLHELFIFFAVLGGLQVFGIVGLFLGPVILAIALALFDAFLHPDTSLKGGRPTIPPPDMPPPPVLPPIVSPPEQGK